MKHLFIIIALFVGNVFSQEVSEFEFRKKMEEYLAKEDDQRIKERIKNTKNLYYDEWESLKNAEKNTVLDIYFYLVSNLEILAGDREAPNNEKQCINFYLNTFIVHTSLWTVTENHDNKIGCEGSPTTEPTITNITSVYAPSVMDKPTILFTKWCSFDDGFYDVLVKLDNPVCPSKRE